MVGAEVFADATRGVARQVQSVMQSPSAVVVPQMMGWVSPVDSNRKGCATRVHCINTEQNPASNVAKQVAAREILIRWFQLSFHFQFRHGKDGEQNNLL